MAAWRSWFPSMSLHMKAIPPKTVGPKQHDGDRGSPRPNCLQEGDSTCFRAVSEPPHWVT
jgi:hypothetical protein